MAKKKRTAKQIAAFKKMRAALEKKRGKKKRRKKSGGKKRRKKSGGKKRRKKSGRKRKPRKASRPRASRRKVSGEKRSTISANEVLALARAGKLR